MPGAHKALASALLPHRLRSTIASRRWITNGEVGRRGLPIGNSRANAHWNGTRSVAAGANEVLAREKEDLLRRPTRSRSGDTMRVMARGGTAEVDNRLAHSVHRNWPRNIGARCPQISEARSTTGAGQSITRPGRAHSLPFGTI